MELYIFREPITYGWILNGIYHSLYFCSNIFRVIGLHEKMKMKLPCNRQTL